MRLLLQNESFDTDQITAVKINQKNLSPFEIRVLTYAKQWLGDQTTFEFQTSGSTGSPKRILLTRQQLNYSISSSIEYLFGELPIKSAMLCIDPKFVGGRQVIYRAGITDSDLIVKKPSANPLVDLDQEIDLVSLVPFQVRSILNETPEKFHNVKCVLIGGAAIGRDIQNRLSKMIGTRFFQTFGMTETASHIALRPIQKQYFEKIGDVQIKLDDRSCLRVKGTITNQEWIQTNDVIKLRGQGFEWLGRSDFVINSGGLKIHPEVIEEHIRNDYPNVNFAISSCPDGLLGERMILITTEPLLEEIRNSKHLGKHEIPKEEIIVHSLPTLSSGKLDRLELKKFSNSLN